MLRPLTALIGLLLATAAAWAQAPTLTLSTTQPGNMFAAGSAPTVEVKSAAPSCAWQVTDWMGQEVAKGATDLAQGQGQLRLPALERGYYELQAKAGESVARLTLGVITDRSGQNPPSGRINVDAAAAWLAQPEQFDSVAKMLRMMGIGWVRERFSWSQTEPERDKVDWRQYDANAQAYRRQGVRVYQTFHDVPGWTRGEGQDAKGPQDLRDVYRFTRRLAEHYRGQVAAWEVWNEPDVPFWPELSDTYAGLAKAGYLGFKAGDPSVTVLLGSWIRGNSPFAESVMSSGMSDYFDVFNWHCYSQPSAYEAILTQYRELLGRHGCADRPVWLTECGITIKPTGPDGELSPAEERAQAEFIPRSFASSLAAGTDRHFFFVFPYYLENGLQFGALRRDMSPRPACVAIAVAADLLGEAQYLGRYFASAAPEVTALAFRAKDERLLVIWSDKPATINLPVDAPQVRVADLMGRTRVEHTVDGTLTLPVGPASQYVIGFGRAVEGVLKKQTPAELKLPRNAPSPVVLRGRAEVANLDKELDAYVIDTMPFTFTIEVYNFDEGKTADGTLHLTLPDGWRAEPESASVALTPMGRATKRFTITPAKTHQRHLRITATPEFVGVNAAPSMSRFWMRQELPLAKVPRIEVVDQVTQHLAQLEPRVVKGRGGEVASLRFAVAGDDLAISAVITDQMPTQADPPWKGSALEVFASAPGSEEIAQVFLLPATGDKLAAGLKAASPKPLLMSEIRVVSKSADKGYTLQALVPLSLLGVDPAAAQTMLEFQVGAVNNGKLEFTTLFDSVRAYKNNRLYGLFNIGPAAKP